MRITLSVLAGICLCCSLLITIDGFMKMDDFNAQIKPYCYHHSDEILPYKELPNGQVLPIPNTIEAFISLVEKIEDGQKQRTLEDVIKILLVNFRYDDVIYSQSEDGFQSRSAGATNAFDILKILFGKPSSSTSMSSLPLTQDEKCALFFMISHTVNSTIREGDEITNVNQADYLKHPREQGVVTIDSDSLHAFAVGKVLLGLLAGIRPGSKMKALDAYIALKGANGEAKPSDTVEVDLLYAATFGDLVSLAKDILTNPAATIEQKNNPFLPNGWWGEPLCPIDYNLAADKDQYMLLDPSMIHTTYASIRGATDGYVLGKAISKITQRYRDIKLSQILRVFYQDSEALSDGSERKSWCLRSSEYKDIRTEISALAVDYDVLYMAVIGKTVGSVDMHKNNVMKIFDMINSREEPIFLRPFREARSCRSGSTRECETASDVFAIMDFKAPVDSLQMQRELIGNLSSGLKISQQGSSFSVYTNYKPYGGVSGLDTIINNTKYSGCAGCATKYYILRQGTAESEAEVIRDLNYTLSVFSDGAEEESGVPAKVVLYFNYGAPNNEDYQLKQAMYDLRRQHADARVIAFGVRKENLKVFVQDNDKDVEVTTILSESSLQKTKDKVCKVPAIFQYKNCAQRTDADELSNKYEGFITPNRVQYWAMYPKYFLKSYGIKLSFKAMKNNLKVCFSRNYGEIFDQNEPRGDCKDTTTSTNRAENTVEFTVSNPCHRYNVENCPPFYFYVEGKAKDTTSNDQPCIDKRCSTPDQIPFEFTHQGISCNKGTVLSSVVPAVFYAILASVFWLLSSTRGQ